jgi:hypothetical protein
MTRYYLNNFADGFRQDAYDLFVGNHLVDPAKESPFARASGRLWYLSVLLLALIMLFMVMFFPSSMRRREGGKEIERKREREIGRKEKETETREDEEEEKKPVYLLSTYFSCSRGELQLEADVHLVLDRVSVRGVEVPAEERHKARQPPPPPSPPHYHRLGLRRNLYSDCVFILFTFTKYKNTVVSPYR